MVLPLGKSRRSEACISRARDLQRSEEGRFLCRASSGKSPQKKQGYVDRAMELLNKAVKAGLRDGTAIKQDNDLRSLRDRDDFKELIAELTNGKQAAKKHEHGPNGAPWRVATSFEFCRRFQGDLTACAA